MKLLDGQTDNGNGTAVGIRQGLNRELSHLYTLFVSGTFDSGTVGLQISPTAEGDTWFDVPDVAVTAKGCINVEFRAVRVRAVVTTVAGAAADLDAILL